MSQLNQTYAQRKLDAIVLAAELNGEITLPARQFHGMLEILGMAEDALREILEYSTDRSIGLAHFVAREALVEMDKRAEIL